MSKSKTSGSSQNKNQYSSEYRNQAVNLYLSQDRTAAEVARELGIKPHQLRAWIRQAKNSSSESKSQRTVLDENAQLRKELKTLRQEVEILKKAATYFAKNLS